MRSRRPSGFRLPTSSDTPWDGTLPLLELKDTLAGLEAGPAVSSARSLLRGPSFTCPNYSAAKPNTKSTQHFYIQYKNSTLQGLTINQYASALETTWDTEITDFGWAKPPKDPVRYPKGGRYPVRIESLGTGLYGYVTGTHYAGNNPDTPWNDKDAVASCMVLNQNFVPFPGTPTAAMQATVAHEFNHSTQFAYGALTGYGKVTSVFVEAGATWMEDEVFDGANDNWNYLWPEFTRPMGVYKVFPYPYWVVLRAMSEPFGTGTAGGGEDIYQAFWEQISKGQSTNLAALNKAFKTEGSSLAEAYHDASIALRFLQDCTNTAEPYCLQEGPDYATFLGGPDDMFTLSSTDSRSGRKIANDYAMNWVGLPTGENDLPITVDVTNGKGALQISVACLDGDEVTVQPVGKATLANDASASVDTSACDQASAVISNVKMTSPSPKAITKTTYTITTG